MKGKYLKQKGKLGSILLLGVSTVAAVLIFTAVTGFLATSSKADTLVNGALAQGKPDPKEVEERLAGSKAIATELKQNNLFAPPPPKEHPVKAVSGIMGDEVLIGDRWYKVGDRVGDANIVAIEATLVRIAWDGSEKTFAPIDAPIPAGPPGPKPGAEVAKAGQPGEGGPEMVQIQGGGPPMGGGPGMGRFGGLSEEQRAAMRARFEGMRERFENMSEEERDRIRAEMRERFGGRGGPGGGGGDFGGRGPGRGRR